LGRWTISEDRLTIIFTTGFGDDPNPEVDRIVKLTKTDLVIEVVSKRKDRGARYSYKRVRKPGPNQSMKPTARRCATG
jgi:hypothetical protein